MTAGTLPVPGSAAMPPTGDDGLLSRLRAGDADTKRRLFDAEGPRVWSLIHRLCGDYDLAHDVVQETFLHAFRKIGQYDGSGTLRAWLCQLAVNRLRDLQRTARRRTLALQREELQGSTVQSPGDPLLRDRVRAAVDALSPPLRVVLVMHDVEGFTHEEISQVLRIAPGSSRARLSRARATLRGMLSDLRPEER